MSFRPSARPARARQPGAFESRSTLEPLERRILLSALTIAQENQLPGTPQSVWDVSGAGDPSLQGFASDISVNAGAAVNFKIDDTARVAYHLDVYRMGYYGGDGARLVATLPASLTQDVVQPAPLTNLKTGLVDCGNWTVTARWEVPADATSGIYFAKVIREDTGGASHIVFLVRNDAGHSDILFQTSDQTWEAYNTFGGASLYRGNGPGGALGRVRAYAVSYNRPFANRATPGSQGQTDWVFYGEYPMVRFLERNGCDVSYQAGVDGARLGPSQIEQHRVFMSVGHDEYWSGPQRAAVEAARDHGVNLAFMSGNESFWKTRWEPSIDGSAEPYKTLVCYKESLAGAKIDPSTKWTGLWRDGRFSPPADGGRPENGLSGQLFSVNRGPDAVGTPITIPFADSRFRFWRNTSVANLAPGGVATVGHSVLGYEWDEDLFNGSRPAGEIDLSSTTEIVPQKIRDLNTDLAPGVATHHLSLYRTPGGALVFGAGTVQWDWGLDSHHDGKASDGSAPPADSAIQQATVNLLADMRSLPATLQPGLAGAGASTDHTPPASTIDPPPGGALVVQAGGSVKVSGTSVDGGGGVVAGVEVSVDGGKTWNRADGFERWSFTWAPAALGPETILVRASDDSANTETPKRGATFNVVPPVADGVYSVQNAFSRLVLDDPGWSTRPGTSIGQWSPNRGLNQKWKFSYQGNGFYTIRNVFSGLFLADPFASRTRGTPLEQNAADGNADELWSFAPSGSSFIIRNKASGLVIEDPGFSTALGTVIDLWTANGGANQAWAFIKA